MIQLSKNIRTLLGRYRFVKDMKKAERNPDIISFDDAASIGILYEATDERNSDSIKNYVKSTRGTSKKDILAMGFVDKKSFHPGQYAQFGLDFFNRKDLNFQMIPSNPIITNFINEPFDILINVATEKCFPLHYITVMSKAKFKVGIYSSSGTKNYDMMVQLDREAGLKVILGQIEHFLRQIKKS